MELARKSLNRPCLFCARSQTFTATTFSSPNTTPAAWQSSVGARRCRRATLDACVGADAVLLGAVGSPDFDHLPPDKRPEAGLLLLRRSLGGFANLRPITSFRALAGASPLRSEIIEGADILFVRELLGGLYFGEPRGLISQNGSSSAFNTMRYTVSEIERVARVAFAAAARRRCKVTSVDKANVLETSQLWRQTVSRVATGIPAG